MLPPSAPQPHPQAAHPSPAERAGARPAGQLDDHDPRRAFRGVLVGLALSAALYAACFGLAWIMVMR